MMLLYSIVGHYMLKYAPLLLKYRFHVKLKHTHTYIHMRVKQKRNNNSPIACTKQVCFSFKAPTELLRSLNMAAVSLNVAAVTTLKPVGLYQKFLFQGGFCAGSCITRSNTFALYISIYLSVNISVPSTCIFLYKMYPSTFTIVWKKKQNNNPTRCQEKMSISIYIRVPQAHL